VRATIVAIILVLLSVGVQVRAEGQEVPTGTEGRQNEPTDTSPIVIIQPKETAKPQPQKDRMLTEEEAYDLVWNLPEVKKEIERLLEQGGVPFSTVGARPSPANQPEEGKSSYAIHFQGLRAKDVLVDLLFSVDVFTCRISVYDSSTESFISLDDWRRQRK
jgi:hypothetical protein